MIECSSKLLPGWSSPPEQNKLILCLFVFLHSYEFKVKPKNELGEGPSSEPVSFNTESGDYEPKLQPTAAPTMFKEIP